MTIQVNKTLTEAEGIFKQLVWDPLFLAGETALLAAVPILNAPVIGAFDKMILQDLSDWVFNQIVLFADITAIKIINEEHQSAYEKASESLMIITKEKGKDSDEYKQELDKALDSMCAFTSFNK